MTASREEEGWERARKCGRWSWGHILKTSEKQEATSCGGEVERRNRARLVRECCVVLLDNCAIGKERKRESVEHELLFADVWGKAVFIKLLLKILPPHIRLPTLSLLH